MEIEPGERGPRMADFFEGFDLAARPEQVSAGFCDKNEMLRQCSVQELIYRYRDLGHVLTCLDPLGQMLRYS